MRFHLWTILNIILTKGPKLRELYLRRNVIKDLNEVQFLKDLPKLKVLWLSDNPCSEEQDYRSTVLKNLPNIEKLDNIGWFLIIFCNIMTAGFSLFVGELSGWRFLAIVQVKTNVHHISVIKTLKTAVLSNLILHNSWKPNLRIQKSLKY